MFVDYTEWHEPKKDLPPIGMVVEVLGPKGWFYTSLGRDYFALVAINDELIWISPSLTDFTYKELDVKYWRYIPPDPKGKIPFVRIKHKKGYWEPKIHFEINEK